MNRKKPNLLLVIILMVILLAIPPIVKSFTEAKIEVTVTVDNYDSLFISKHGNVYCNCTAEDFSEIGFTWGDIVRVEFLDRSLVLPIVPTYSYVSTGSPTVIMKMDESGNPAEYIALAINMGNFSETYGIAAKKTDDNGDWYFEPFEGVEFPIEVTFIMEEQGGGLHEYMLESLNLKRTNIRSDYSHLSDEQFANFRLIAGSGEGVSAIYRSSNPIDPQLGRNTYAHTAMESAGVKTVVNLTDSLDGAKSYPKYSETYYSQQNVFFRVLSVNFFGSEFQKGLADALRHMASNEGPYLIHCTEGKDRAGFVSAILSCFVGASYEEILEDYMVTYYNYYGVQQGSDAYDRILENNIDMSLRTALNLEDPYSEDLQAAVKEYFLSIGLTETEITALAENLK